MTIEIKHEFIPCIGIGIGRDNRVRHGWKWYGIVFMLPFIALTVMLKWKEVDDDTIL